MSPATMTRIEAEALTREIIETQLNLATVTSEMELAITEIREKFEGRIDSLVKAEASKIAALREWAEAHPEEFPKGDRSIQFAHARIGLRKNPPKLDKVSKKTTWEQVLENIRRLPSLRGYIRNPPAEINKEAIIADRAKIGDEKLVSVGLRITQGETFYIEPEAQGVELGHKEQV